MSTDADPTTADLTSEVNAEASAEADLSPEVRAEADTAPGVSTEADAAPEAGAAGIEGVIFDFGGVFTASPFAAVAQMGADHGLAAEVAIELVFGVYDRDTDHPWHRAERGELDISSCRNEIRELSRTAGTELDLYKLLGYMSAIESGVRDAVVARVRRARSEGLRTGLLTNNVAEFAEFWRPMLPLDELFDDVVDSSEVAMRKPDARIYELALDRLELGDPTRAVFVDDHPANVAAAVALGMHGVVIDDPWAEAFERLDTLLGW